MMSDDFVSNRKVSNRLGSWHRLHKRIKDVKERLTKDFFIEQAVAKHSRCPRTGGSLAVFRSDSTSYDIISGFLLWIPAGLLT
jgi:hypothetical protein